MNTEIQQNDALVCFHLRWHAATKWMRISYGQVEQMQIDISDHANGRSLNKKKCAQSVIEQ